MTAIYGFAAAEVGRADLSWHANHEDSQSTEERDRKSGNDF